jgi:hypothetical protein
MTPDLEALFEELQNSFMADKRLDDELAWLVLHDSGRAKIVDDKRVVRHMSQDVPFNDWIKEHGLRYTGSFDAAVTLYPEKTPKMIPGNPRQCCAHAIAERLHKKPHYVWRFLKWW